MIKLKTPSFIAIGIDIQTSTKVSVLGVNYQEVLGTKGEDENPVPQGYISSWMFDEKRSTLMQAYEENTDPKFEGKKILEVLTEDYIAKLKALNPKVEFINTLVK